MLSASEILGNQVIPFNSIIAESGLHEKKDFLDDTLYWLGYKHAIQRVIDLEEQRKKTQ